MTKVSDLAKGDLGDRIAKLERAQRRSGLNNASIGRGGLRIHDGGRLTLDGGETTIYFEIRDLQGFMVFSKVGISSRLSDPAIWSHDTALVLAGPRTTASTAGVGFSGSRLDLGDTSAIFQAGEQANKGAHVVVDQSGFWDIGGDVNQSLAHVVGYSDGVWDIGGERSLGLASAHGSADGSWSFGNTTAYIIAGASGPVQIVGGLETFGAKNFVMPHPTKAGHLLRHGATESPVSGTEYTGRAMLDSKGEAVIELPAYFEALNKPEGRTVQLTPVGRPFPVGADDVIGGRTTIYGEPNREVFWLVKAERFGGDFPVEELGSIKVQAPTEPTKES